MWVRRIEKLSDTTVSQPQAAFAALSKVLQFEWSYLQRVVNDDSAAYLPISECLTDRFFAIYPRWYDIRSCCCLCQHEWEDLGYQIQPNHTKMHLQPLRLVPNPL